MNLVVLYYYFGGDDVVGCWSLLLSRCVGVCKGLLLAYWLLLFIGFF